MTYDIDATLAEIRQLGERIDAMAPGTERQQLEAKREELRDRARLAADAARPLTLLRAELRNVEAQIEAMEGALIKPAMNEHYKMITDPSAYRRRINERLEQGEAERRTALEKRRVELSDAIAAAQAD